MRKILVTGGAGYLGSMLVNNLIHRGDEVTVIDSLRFGGSSLAHLAAFKNFKFVEGDVRDLDLMADLVKDAEFIFPLAALVGAPLCEKHPKEAEEVNFSSIKSLLELVGDQKIIYPTTNSGYGMKEAEEVCTEESELTPVSLYGRTKVDAEKLIQEAGNGVSLRLATVFGSSFRTRFDLLLNNFVLRSLKDKKIEIYEGHFKRNFIHISDVIDGLIFSMDNFEKMRGSAFNLGQDSANMSKMELALKVKNFVPELVLTENNKEKDPDQRNYIVSNEKIRKLGFTPRVTIEEGIAEMIKVVRLRPNISENL
ncbi:MAG: nucleoside-diphosphate-sugar epimerase [Bacteriovoracaceae bacterium]|jgi:nucleoside-diphosphate-sugar epimerase